MVFNNKITYIKMNDTIGQSMYNIA
jgi:hypothetical protein